MRARSHIEREGEREGILQLSRIANVCILYIQYIVYTVYVIITRLVGTQAAAYLYM